MRALLVLVLASGCATTFTDQFFEVTPVRAVPSHGTSCAELCSSKRDYDGIDYCVIATIDTDPKNEPHLVCAFHHKRAAATL